MSVLDRIRGLSPARAARLFPVSLACGSALILALIEIQRLAQPQSPYFETLLTWAGIGLLVALVLRASPAPGPFVLPRWMSPSGFIAYALAMQAAIVLSVVPAYLLVWITTSDLMGGWSLPFLNKRWVAALYGLAIAAFLVFPAIAHRVLESSLPPDEAIDAAPALASHQRRSKVGSTATALAVIAIAWYFAGPPWHVERHHRAIDFHEQVHLGPLQAIRTGALPFVGPASTQYGPGSQLLTYGLMKASGHFDIVSFREAQLWINFATFAGVGLVAAWWLGFWGVLIVLLLGIPYSPLAFFQVFADAAMGGSFGWANGLRYLGPLVVVPFIGRLAFRARDTGLSRRSAVGLGIAWGVFAWISQENLSSTLTAGGLLLVLLWATETITSGTLFSMALGLAGGFLLLWIPIVVFYAAHGAAGAFLRDYFLVAQAVAMGFSNTWWAEGPAHPHASAFYYTPVLLIAMGVLTLCDVGRLTPRRRLDERQCRLLAFVCVMLACYQTALYRSDTLHLMNTLIALPFVLFLGFVDLPDWSARTWPGRSAVRLLFVAVALFIYPIGPRIADAYNGIVHPPLARFLTLPALPPAPANDGRVPFQRATPYLSDEPLVAAGMIPMRRFLEITSDLRDLIGARRTYIDGPVGGGYSGLLLFMMDLRPGPYLLDKETMVINGAIADEAFYHFTQHVQEFECVITLSLDTREAQAFMKAFPQVRVFPSAFGDKTFQVLVR